jgi:hypothetical protein
LPGNGEDVGDSPNMYGKLVALQCPTARRSAGGMFRASDPCIIALSMRMQVYSALNIL